VEKVTDLAMGIRVYPICERCNKKILEVALVSRLKLDMIYCQTCWPDRDKPKPGIIKRIWDYLRKSIGS